MEKVRFWQIMPLWNSYRDIRFSTVFVNWEVFPSLNQWRRPQEYSWKTSFFEAVTVPKEALESINRTFLAEIWGVTFKGFLFKRSYVQCLKTDNRTSCQSCKLHLGLSGSDCAFRWALCWLKRRGQAINDIRAGVSYFRQSKNRFKWSDVNAKASYAFPILAIFLVMQGLNCFQPICVNRSIDTQRYE